MRESALDQVISFPGTNDQRRRCLGRAGAGRYLKRSTRRFAPSPIRSRGGHSRIVDEVVSRGYDLRNFCREMMVHIRALLVVKMAGFDAELVQLPEAKASRSLRRLARIFGAGSSALLFYPDQDRAGHSIHVAAKVFNSDWRW